MAKFKKEELLVGVVKFDPRKRPSMGHEYGAGRPSEAHRDVRTRRRRTRQADRRAAIKEGW